MCYMNKQVLRILETYIYIYVCVCVCVCVCYPPSPQGAPKTINQLVTKAILQIPRENSPGQYQQEPELYSFHCTLLFVAGRVERLEFR